MFSVQSISEAIKNVLNSGIRAAAPQLSAIVMLCSLAKRPGLSTIVSVMNIVQQFKKRGIPTEPNEDGSPNLNIQLAYVVVDEIYRALREDANIQGAVAPSAIPFLGQVSSASGQVSGTNIGPFKVVNQVQ